MSLPPLDYPFPELAAQPRLIRQTGWILLYFPVLFLLNEKKMIKWLCLCRAESGTHAVIHGLFSTRLVSSVFYSTIEW